MITHTHTHTNRFRSLVCVYLYVCRYTCVCVCVCVHTDTHTHTYTHIYNIYIHTCPNTHTQNMLTIHMTHYFIFHRQGLKRGDQSTMMDIYKSRNPGRVSSGQTERQSLFTSSESVEQETSRIKKLEKLIKRRL